MHNGALVNHVAKYDELYKANVLGTVRVMEFALAGRRKSISFLSSVVVLDGAVKHTKGSCCNSGVG